MLFRSPISAIIPTLEGAVLEALERTSEPLTLSQVHTLIGKGSLSGIRKALVRLVASGVVHISGSPPRYVLNRDHVTYPAVSNLVGARATLIQRIREAVAEWPQSPVLVGVFGSFARGEGDSTSDIDLLVIGEPDPADVTDLALAVERWTGNDAQIVVLTPGEFHDVRATEEAIVKSWEEDLIVIAGTVQRLVEVG